MKFLVMWRIEIALMSRGVVDAVLKMADYAKPLEESHKVLSRYHIPGAHGASGYTRSTPTKNWICCSRGRRSITSHGTKCSNCGTRFTIVIGVPYDRSLTTMARFAMLNS